MKSPTEVRSSFDTMNLKAGRYLLAFSGGPDSVYLLLCLHLYLKDVLKDHVSLIYVNYHDSEFVPEEERIVYSYKEKYNLTIYRTDTDFTLSGKPNFEDWARDFRYHFFADTAKKEGYDGVLTAHHQLDHIETYLLQKSRKNLPLHYGLKEKTEIFGISVFRPLLSVSKENILNTLKTECIPYFDDPTNQKTTRGQVRRKGISEEEIQSLLLELNQKNEELKALYQRFRSLKPPYSFSDYDSFHPEEKQRFCFSLLDQKNIKERREGIGKDMYAFLRSRKSDSLILNSSFTLYKTETYFFISKPLEDITYSYVFSEPGVYQTPYFTIDLRDLSFFNLHSFPVLIRNHEKGDRIGTNLSTKDVDRFLKSQQVPFYLRNLYPVFIEEDHIQCVPFYEDIQKGMIPFSFCITKEEQ